MRWRESEDGRVVVFRPRLGESKVALWIASRLGVADHRIRLDEIGSHVWKLCDGQKTAPEISRAMHVEFGRTVEPAEERLQTFILQMSQAKMININPPASKGNG